MYHGKEQNNTIIINQQNETDHLTDIDLSATLVERRKRLHNLANEINNWEDESTPNKKYLLIFFKL